MSGGASRSLEEKEEIEDGTKTVMGRLIQGESKILGVKTEHEGES